MVITDTVQYNDIYRGRSVLVTGHTGFKGSWLAYWLTLLGAKVTGIGLNPESPQSHYDILSLWESTSSYLMDIRPRHSQLGHVMRKEKPEIVFHLAANAIVAKTFDDPAGTFETNIMTAVNVLEECRLCPSVKAVVMITTDKVYENKEWVWGYRESDELGGSDPYSASKVCVEHVIRCYRENYIPMIATARAGNVIGGGDWAYARLIPDIARAAAKKEPVEIHTPNATRPWQHVLEALNGYLLLGQKLLEGNKYFSDAWGFGPSEEMTVLDILRIAKKWWPDVEYHVKEENTHPHMVYLLKIDSSRAKTHLGWEPKWTMETAVSRSINWYKRFYQEQFVMTHTDIKKWEGAI